MRHHLICRIFFDILLCTFIPFELSAGTIHSHTRLFSTTNYTVTIPGNYSFVSQAPPAGQTSFTDISANCLISFGVDNNVNIYLDSLETDTLVIDVNPLNISGNPTGATFRDSLIVDYNPFTGAALIRNKSSVLHQYCYGVQVSVLNLLNGISYDHLPKHLFIDIDFTIERIFQFDGHVPSFTTANYFNYDCDGIPDEFQFNWSYDAAMEEYQLEWTYINDYDSIASNIINPNNLMVDFKLNSSRISTRNNSYSIPLMFDRGYLIYRLRGIGKDQSTRKNIYGFWTSPDVGTVSSMNNKIYIHNVFEKKKNWHLSTTYAEEGKKKEVVNYADGSLKSRQTVTKINTDSTIIVGETIFDKQGRPAVNILPVPNYIGCSGSSPDKNLKYYVNFNKAENSTKYLSEHFDLDGGGICDLVTTPLDSSTGAQNYYSGSNPELTGYQGLVPGAKGYPYTQTEYTPDNTGRIRRQGGVGPEFQLNGEHATKYFYGQPNQIQLDRLFGSEAGDVTHYKKNIIVDPNGQASASYLNQDGKVVATALSGEAPEEQSEKILQPLRSEQDASKSFYVDLFNYNTNGVSGMNTINQTHDGIEFNSHLTVSADATFDFQFDLTIQPFTDPCLNNICFNCIYNLDIVVKDDCSNPLFVASRKTGHIDYNTSNGTYTFINSCGPWSDDESFSLFMKIGNYSVSKTLMIDTVARNFYVDQYLSTEFNHCYLDSASFAVIELAGLDTSCCAINCQTCIEELGTKENFVSSGRGTDLQYDYLFEQCEKPCRPVSLCEETYDQMLIDVSKDGQYGEYNFNNEIHPEHFELSVFNEANTLPLNVVNPNTANWRHPELEINGSNYPYYLNEMGNRDIIYLLRVDSTHYLPEPYLIDPAHIFNDPALGYYTYPENLKRVEDFLIRFRSSWAKSIVKYHPEYCYYKICRQMGIRHANDSLTSDAFDDLLRNTESYKDALNIGLIDTSKNGKEVIEHLFIPGSGHMRDPFFTNSTGAYTQFINTYNLLNKMIDRVNHFQVIDSSWKDMVQTAASSTRCQYFNSVSLNITDDRCFDFGNINYYDNSIQGNADKNDSIIDQEWTILRNFYLDAKARILYDFQNSFAKYFCNGYNGCIGTGTNTSGNISLQDYTAVCNNAAQPCSFSNAYKYATKRKRFVGPGDIPFDDPAFQNFNLSGQCPIASQFQGFLNALTNRKDLARHPFTSLNNYPEFTNDLYSFLYNPQLLSNSDSLKWQGDTTSATLTGYILGATSGNLLCSVALDKNGNQFYWKDIISIIRLEYTGQAGSNYTFKAVAIVPEVNVNGSIITGSNHYYDITGTTCFKLGPCEFKDVCESNQLAKDLNMLMSLLASNNQLMSTVQLSVSPYNQFLTQRIRNAVRSVAGNLEWKYTGGTSFTINDPIAPDFSLHIDFITFTPSSFSTQMNSLRGFSGLTRKNQYINSFIIDGLNGSGAQIATMEGKIELVNTALNSHLIFSMGTCGQPTPVTCIGNAYDARNELEELLNDALVQQAGSGSIDLYLSPYFSPILLSYLPHNFSGTIATLKHVNGWPYIDSLIFNFLPEESADCKLKLAQSEFGVPDLQFSELTGVTNLTGIDPKDFYDNYLGFYFIGTFNKNGTVYTDTVFGEGCFPVKNCETCSNDVASLQAAPAVNPGMKNEKGNQLNKINTEPESINSIVKKTLADYLTYRTNLSKFNLRKHLADPSWKDIEPLTITEFYSITKNHDLKSYFDFLEKFDTSNKKDTKRINIKDYFSSKEFNNQKTGYDQKTGLKKDFLHDNINLLQSLSSSTVKLTCNINSQFVLYPSTSTKLYISSSFGGFNCEGLKNAVELYNSLPAGSHPPLYIFLNSVLNAGFSHNEYVLFFSNCDIDFHVIEVDCSGFIDLLKNCINNQNLIGCLNSNLQLNLTAGQYLEWFRYCDFKINEVVNCNKMTHLINNFPCNGISLFDYLNDAFGYDMPPSFWIQLMNECNIQINCTELCEKLNVLQNYTCVDGDVFTWLNIKLNLNLSALDYYLLFRECNIQFCFLVNCWMSDYNCEKTSFDVWLNYKSKWELSEEEWVQIMLDCGIPFPCCEKIKDVISGYPCDQPLYAWLNQQFGWQLSDVAWIAILGKCNIDIKCYNCSKIKYAIGQIGCSSYIFDELNKLLGYHFTPQEYYHILLKCGNCDIFNFLIRDCWKIGNISCTKADFVEYLNTQSGWTLTGTQWMNIFSLCGIELPCCSDYREFIGNNDYPCDQMTYIAWLNSSFNANYSLATWISIFSTCKITVDTCASLNCWLMSPSQQSNDLYAMFNIKSGWNLTRDHWNTLIANCGFGICDQIHSLHGKFPCKPGQSYIAWLNDTLNLNYTNQHWQNIFDICGKDDLCRCTYLTQLVNAYPCNGSTSLVGYLNSVTNWGLTQTDFISLLDSCNISWRNKCVSCPTLTTLNHLNPCLPGQTFYSWLNSTLQLHYSNYEWSLILQNCPLDSTCYCQYLETKLDSFPCHGDTSLYVWLNSHTGWNWTDPATLINLSNCGLIDDWISNCINCDSVQLAAWNFFRNQGVDFYDYMNSTLNYSFTPLEWDTIFRHCPVDTCTIVGRTIRNYNCHDTIPLADWLNTQLGWSYSAAAYVDALHKCHYDTTWIYHCLDCSVLNDLISQNYSCDTGTNIVAWLNDTLNMSLEQPFWNMIFNICRVDSCPLPSCSTLYAGYTNAYNNFSFPAECDSVSFYTMDDIIDYNLCCSDAGKIMFMNYIQQFSPGNCPESRPPYNDDCGTPCGIITSALRDFQCHDTLSLTEWLNTQLEWTWTDTMYLDALHNCHYDTTWVRNCVNCATLQAAANNYPCGSGYPFTAWLNQELNYSFTPLEWNTIFSICPVDTCVPPDSCNYLYNNYLTAYNNYQGTNCTIPLFSYYDFITHNLCCTDSGYMMFHQYLQQFTDTSACPDTILPFVTYCDTIHDTCQWIYYHSYNYNCHDTLTFAQWLNTLSGWTLTDTTYYDLMNRCRRDSIWLYHCFNCDSLQDIALSFPCDSGYSFYAWLNDTLNVNASPLEWSIFFSHCPIDTCPPPGCDTLYARYDSAWHHFTPPPGCQNIPFYSRSEIERYNLCCSDSAKELFQQYIDEFMPGNCPPLHPPYNSSCGTVCGLITSVFRDYACHDTISIAEWMNTQLGWNWTDTMYLDAMNNCHYDTTWFYHCVSCDSIQMLMQSYPCYTGISIVSWLNDTLNLNFTDYEWQNILTHCDVDSICPDDNCVIYYNQYTDAYHSYYAAQQNNATCNPVVRFYTYQEFLDHDLCCSDPGLISFANYIAQFLTPPVCPLVIPSGPACNNDTGTYCDTIFHDYLTMIGQYNVSNFALAHNHTLAVGLFTSSLQFEGFGLCDCAEIYLDSLRPYLTALPNASLPLPVDINVSPVCGPVQDSCLALYNILNQTIDAYNNSTYSHQDSLLYHYPDYNSFLASGNCICAASYISYLDSIVNAAADSAIAIWNFPDCHDSIYHDPCERAYIVYTTAVYNYNTYVQFQTPAGTPWVTNIHPQSDFTSAGYCYCVDDYAGYLASLTSIVFPSGETLDALQTSRLDITNYCIPPECHDSIPLLAWADSSYSVDPDLVNPCEEQLLNIALQNAWIEYQHYRDSIRVDINERYTEHCLGALESFTYDYVDKEYHFTLYYYDQAGNLIKTVPPEGVTMLPCTSFTDPIDQQINHDRTTGEKTVFTEHVMPTVYEYNSQNQLTRQNLPDQRTMNIWEYSHPSGLRNDIIVTSTQFVTPNRGYLTAYTTGNPVKDRGYLYTTNDGGATWKRLYDLVAADFNKIQLVDNAVGYAVGNDGVVVKTADGGNTWDQLATYTQTPAILSGLSDLHVIFSGGHYTGYIAGEQNSLYKLDDNNAGTITLTPVTFNTTSTVTFTSVTFNGIDFFAGGYNAAGIGIIYKINGSSGVVTEINNFSTVGINDVCYVAVQIANRHKAFAAGIDGNLLKTEDDGLTWKLIHTGLTSPISKIWFRNDNIGLALIDSANENHLMYKTADGGHTWELAGRKGEYFNDMNFETDSTGIAVGKNGLIRRIIVNTSGHAPYFGLITLQRPSSMPATTNIRAVCSSVYDIDPGTGKLYHSFVSLTGEDNKLYTTQDAGASLVTWVDHAYTPVNYVTRLSHSIKETINGNNHFYLFYVALAENLQRSQFYLEKLNVNTVTGGFYNLQKPLDIYDVKSTPGNLFYALGKHKDHSTTDCRIYTVNINTANVNPVTLNADSTGVIPGTVFPVMDIDSSGRAIVADQTLINNIFSASASMGPSVSFSNRYRNVKPLPFHDLEKFTTGEMITAGDDGTVMISSSQGTEFRRVSTINADKLNAIRYDEISTAGIAVGDSGRIFLLNYNTTYSYFTFKPFDAHITANLHDLSVFDQTDPAFIAGDNGTLLKLDYWTLQNVQSTRLMPSPGTTNFNGLTSYSAGSVIAVGAHSSVYQYNGLTGIKIKDVFGFRLNDVHFRNINEGFAIGSEGTIRFTTDAGSTWSLIKPEANSLPGVVYKSVWNTGPAQLLVAGNGNYLAQRISSGDIISLPSHAFNSSSTQNWNDIEFGKDIVGFTVGSGGNINKLSRNAITGSVSITSTLTEASLTDLNAVHIFGNNHLVAAGNNGKVTYCTGTNFNDLSLSTTSGFRDIYFHDDRNGYVAGTHGEIYRCSMPCNISINTTLSEIDWHRMTAQDGGKIDTSVVDSVIFNVIAFPSRFHGFVAGEYKVGGLTFRGTSYPFARRLHDESFLYSTVFWYDRVGRMVLSQNTKQFEKNPKAYSYTLYDKLGRIKEVGEKQENNPSDTLKIHRSDIFGAYINDYFNPAVINDTTFSQWISESSGGRFEVTKTFYDTTWLPVRPYKSNLTTQYDFDQQNMRNRVASTTYADVYDVDSTLYDYATHYSYDIHGNVKSLIQDNRKLSQISSQLEKQRFKRIDYDYDLISGKVNSVTYQSGQPDQFIHNYEYDADNRITSVLTSTNGIQWDRDAKYFYYAHGPLARMEVGNDQVQGVDYAYTLQGWIKGVNGNNGAPNTDMGHDGELTAGNPNRTFARDAFGYTLNYFEDQYMPADPGRWAPQKRFEANTYQSDVMAARKNLYNGNISMMATTLEEPLASNSSLLNSLPQANAYKYDQLNRLLSSQSFDNIDSSSNLWMNGSTYTNRYLNEFVYDANGNIESQVRDSITGDQVDVLEYLYDSLATCGMQNTYRKANNRLMRVKNYVTGTAVNMNYNYDALGNLIEDSDAEIDTIAWSVSGKIRAIGRTSASTKDSLNFDYDPTGNRIAKHVFDSNDDLLASTYYVRDAQGNILTTYKFTISGAAGSYKLKERNLYGSSRLGINTDSLEMIEADSLSADSTFTHAMGLKQYEMTNHLGNVLSVVTDRKLPHPDGNGGVDFFQPEIWSANDYYPFGMLQPGRKFNAEDYRYGHNGQEKTDEIAGAGNHYTAEFWEYDPRLGRRWNIDPVVKPYESGYTCFGNNPIWFIDHNGADTTISGSITAQSEIMKKEGDPDFVPPGVKLESTAKINAKIVDGKFTSVKQEITPKEFESPVLGGMKPAFTRVSNHKVSISEDGLTANLHYEVETQLSNTEVFGQWVNTLWDDGTIQTNVITVTQSVDIVLKINSITTTFDGSSFPESRYNATYTIDTEKKVLTGTIKNTLEQSSYYKAVKSGTFKERNHPQRKKQVITY